MRAGPRRRPNGVAGGRPIAAWVRQKRGDEGVSECFARSGLSSGRTGWGSKRLTGLTTARERRRWRQRDEL
jgi:hypothetical protein